MLELTVDESSLGKSMRNKLSKLSPLALCVAVALGCNLSNSGGGDRSSSAGSGPSSRSTDGDTLADTTWKGNFKCDDGDEIEANYRFAASGNPIYEYQTKSGAREVELTSEGQVIRFVPPGGGVTTVVVDSISISPEHMSHTISVSEEKTSGGTLDQNRSTIQSEATLSGSELDVEITIRSQGVMSQPGIVVPGDESMVVCRGKLRQ